MWAAVTTRSRTAHLFTFCSNLCVAGRLETLMNGDADMLKDAQKTFDNAAADVQQAANGVLQGDRGLVRAQTLHTSPTNRRQRSSSTRQTSAVLHPI